MGPATGVCPLVDGLSDVVQDGLHRACAGAIEVLERCLWRRAAATHLALNALIKTKQL